MEVIKYGRKKSGIKKELEEVMGQWIASIDDEKLRVLVRENVIVTGGSICSMLMGDKINDYDVYFKSIDAAIAVSQYYMCKRFKMEHCDVSREIVNRDYVRLFTDINSRGISEERVECYVRGGDYHNDDNNADDNEKYSVSYISSNAITLTDKIQIIVRFHGTPSEIHDNYDFAHAKCYYDLSENYLHLDAHAMECMLSRTLIYEGSLYPIASIFRMKKFIERGWRISAGQQLKIMWQISELNLRDMKVLKEQLTGVDMLYMHSIINALIDGGKDVDIDSAYVAKIIDKIFNE